jgi:lipopolysaccharide export LptBFGC system permease protein LptF
METLKRIMGGITVGLLVIGVFVLMGVMISEFLTIVQLAAETYTPESY